MAYFCTCKSTFVQREMYILNEIVLEMLYQSETAKNNEEILLSITYSQVDVKGKFA